MEIDPYLLAYNVLNSNWPKFGIPPDITPPETEKGDSLDSIIPGFSKAVLLFQIASRNEWKAFLDNECLTAHNESNVYARLVNIMNKALPKDKIIVDPPSKAMSDWLKECQSKGIPILEADLPEDLRQDLLEDALKEDLFVDVVEIDLLEDDLKEDLPAEAEKEELLVDSVKKDLLEDTLKEDLPAEAEKEELLVDSVKKDLLEDALKEVLHVDAEKKDLLEDALKEDLHLDAEKKDLLADALKEDLHVVNVRKKILEDGLKEGLPGNAIHSKDDLPNIMAYTLAVCTELVLYERENANYKEYVKSMPKVFKKFFRKNMKRLCNNAHYTQDHLKNYSNSIKCPEKFLNDFISENKYEYNDIADKFLDYAEKFSAEKSLEHSKLRTEFEYLPKEMYFRYKKKKFEVLKEICKCVKGEAASDGMALMTVFSPKPTSS